MEALYVVTKEYESVEDGTSQKTTYRGRHVTSYSKAEYMESRLIDLYPNDAYLGMVDATQSFYDSAVAIYNSYPYGWGFSVDTLGSKSSFSYAEGKDEDLEYVSDENEIEILEMTSEEIVKFKAMN